MSIESGFYNYELSGGVPDRVYSAEDWARIVGILYSSGVLAYYGSKLEVIQNATPAMNVIVKTGAIIANGYWCLNTTDLVVSVGAAHGTLNRIDAIVVQIDISVARGASIFCRAGNAAATPSPPAITNTSTVFELCLAYISVPAGSSSVITSRITDKRSDESLCGYSKTVSDIMLTNLYDYVNSVMAGVPTDTDGLPDGTTTRRATKNGSSGTFLAGDGIYRVLDADIIPSTAAKAIPIKNGAGDKFLKNDGTFAFTGLRLLATLTTSGNFVTSSYPSFGNFYLIVLIGGGGSGYWSSTGKGGGAGEIVSIPMRLFSGTYAFTIGAGGVAKETGGEGTAGGKTIFGSLYEAEGGAQATLSAPGLGGTGSSSLVDHTMGVGGQSPAGGINTMYSEYGYGGNGGNPAQSGLKGAVLVYGF